MAYLSPTYRLAEDNQECIDCGASYDATAGGLAWHGRDRQYLICPKCAPMVVAGLANDLADLLYKDPGTYKETPRPMPHYVPYLQRAAHAIEVENGKHHWAEVMDKKGVVSNWFLGTEDKK